MNSKKQFLNQKYGENLRKFNKNNLKHKDLFRRSIQKPLSVSSTIERKRFEMVQIKLASPKTILQWGERKLPNGEIIGEILKPETMNYRTYKPEPSGLLCQKIFLGRTYRFTCPKTSNGLHCFKFSCNTYLVLKRFTQLFEYCFRYWC